MKQNTLRHIMKSNNLIYKNPPLQWWEGWLLGNGKAGATLWNPSHSLQCQYGHTDLIDIDEGGDQEIFADVDLPNVKANDTKSIPCNKHLGQMAIELEGIPLFDPMYLRSYDGELDIRAGVLRVQGESEFGKFHYQTFIHREHDIAFTKYEDRTYEPTRRKVILRRLGSRVLPLPGSTIKLDSHIGLEGTRMDYQHGIGTMEHVTEGMSCRMDLRMDTKNVYRVHVGSHYIIYDFEPCTHFDIELQVYMGVNEPSQLLEEAGIRLMEEHSDWSYEQGLDQHSRNANEPSWGIRLDDDPYWENLWYLGRYHMQASSKGRYPYFFINGPWGGNRDVRFWAKLWLNWNMHGAYIAMPEIGEWDLFDPYINWRMRQLEHGRRKARDYFGCPGMVMEDEQKPQGGSADTEEDALNLHIVPSLQVAIHFYKHWRYTRDGGFLREIMFPFLEETLHFWKAYLVEDEEGIYHIPRSLPYEFHGGYAFRDCLTDMAHLKKVLEVYVELAKELKEDGVLRQWAEEAYGRLAPFQPIGIPEKHYTKIDETGKAYYDSPFFYDQSYQEEDKVLAIGISEEEGRWVSHAETHINRTKGYGAFCSSQTAQIFPCGLVTSDSGPEWKGIMEKEEADREQWRMARNALCTLRRGRDAKHTVAGEPNLSWTGHSLELPAFARLGLSKELGRAMDYYIDRYQMYPQGMWNYHPKYKWITGYITPQGDLEGERLRLEHNPHTYHFGMEPQGIFNETVTLMLLDCTDGLIRLFQAYHKDAWFSLPAWDGFRVTASQKNQGIEYVDIVSTLGGCCCVRLPWKKAYIASQGKERCVTVERGVLKLMTTEGISYRITPKGCAHVKETEQGHRNPEPKSYLTSSLGMYRRM